jgi:ribosomal-protein-alanine N-acetyltransferase
MTGVLHLERIDSPPDADTAAAMLALEVATEPRPLGIDALLRESEADGVVLVARDGGPDGAVVGMASARLLVDDAHVVRLAVDAAWRRRGIGRAMLAGLTSWAGEIGADALVLEVRAGNEAALGLYAEAGMTVEGRRPRYYPDGEDALLLRRTLDRTLGRTLGRTPGRG